MGRTYYPQSDHVEPTMTVGDLINKLQAFDPGDRVIFRSPEYGVFGSNTAYSIDHVAREELERTAEHYPERTYEDEETGRQVTEEAYTQVWNAWSGVVIR